MPLLILGLENAIAVAAVVADTKQLSFYGCNGEDGTNGEAQKMIKSTYPPVYSHKSA
jgi:hypothetical protein